jgi:NADH pyrophosphatase NudC (nudix superfamily)
MAKKRIHRLKLLPQGLSHQYVIPYRPSRFCGICGQRFRDHGESSDWAIDCGRCGMEFAWDCYWGRVAPARERPLAVDEDVLYVYLCHGCRS